jgi:hypothetical protein
MRRLRKSSINSPFITNSMCLRCWTGGMRESWNPCKPSEAPLLPPVSKEWDSEDHLVYVVSESVDQLEPRTFDALASQTQVDGRTAVRLDRIDVGIPAD